ncbi:MAG: FAD-dependent oxidoreductase, partial [Pseudomonadota bacterium]
MTSSARPHVVIVGAGHASLIALDRLAGRLDAEVTLISPGEAAHYSGMVPGWIEGLYGDDEMSVPLRSFAARVGVRFISASVTAADAQAVVCGNARYHYDVLVLNTGAVAARTGALESSGVIPAKPFVELIDGLCACMDDVGAFVIAGAGPAGLEVAMALAHRRPDARVSVVEREAESLGAFPRRFTRLVAKALEACGVRLFLGVEITDVTDTAVV